MALDLEVQIRDYATFLREEAAIDPMAILDEIDQTMPLLKPVRRRHPVLVALAAAVIVLLLGGIGLLFSVITDEPPVVDDPTPTTTTPVSPDALDDASVIIDSAGNVGSQPQMIIGSDGMPLIAYVDDSQGVIKLARCADPKCGDVTVTELGLGSEFVNYSPRITMGSDGLAMITFGNEQELLIFKCSDLSCSDGTLTSISGGGQDLIFATAPDGLPFLAFSNSNADLVGLKCGNIACSDANTLTTLVPREPQGLFVSAYWVAFTVEGLPVVGYRIGDSESGVVACADLACGSYGLLPDSSSLTLDGGIAAGSVVVGPTGQPLLAEFEETESGRVLLVVTACGDPTCLSGTTTQIGQVEDVDGISEPILLHGSDGLPMVFYTARNQLIRVKCSDQNCAGETVTDVLVQRGGTRLDASVSIGEDGRPVIAFYANSDLSFVVCAHPTCADLVTAPAAEEVPSTSDLWVTNTLSDSEIGIFDYNPPYVLDSQGRLITAYIEHIGGESEESLDKIRLVHCLDANCDERRASTVELEAYAVNLTIGSGDLMTMVHQNYQTMSVTHCTNTDCSTYDTSDLVETGSWPHVGIIPTPGAGTMVSYQDWNDYYPRLIRCEQADCRADDVESPIRLFETPDGFRFLMNSYVARIGPDGLPMLLVVQGKEEGNAEVWFARCHDASCIGADQVLVDDGLLDTDTGTLGIGSDGLPLIAYYADGSLTVVKCHDTSCSEHTDSVVGPAIADFIASVAPSIAMGLDGLPVVAYWNPERHVVLAVCSDDFCSQSSLIDFGDVGSHTLGFDPDGLPFLLYYESNELKLARCQNLACLED